MRTRHNEGSSGNTSGEGPSVLGATLIISPHADDEVLGCHVFLRPGTTVCYFGIEERPHVSAAERRKEVAAVARHKGFAWRAFDFEVNRYRGPELIGPLEDLVNELEPGRVLIPHPSYNQDHRAVYDAAMTALRPHDRNWFVPEVLVYEEPDTLWPHGVLVDPNYFVPLDVEDKVKTYELHRSQVRGHRSPQLLRALACIRGSQANVSYAEAFVCRRLVTAVGTAGNLSPARDPGTGRRL